MNKLILKWKRVSLVKQILMGIIIGIILALTFPNGAKWITIFGDLFVGALKAVAPVLVLLLVMNAISRHRKGHKTNMKSILVLYGIGTCLAGLVGVVTSFLFPVTLSLVSGAQNLTPPSGISEVMKTLLFNIVDNPINALIHANYIGILTWAILFGVALRNASESTKNMLENFSDAISVIVKWIINLAPIGIMGLVFNAIGTNGLSALLGYGKLLLVLLGCMVFCSSNC